MIKKKPLPSTRKIITKTLVTNFLVDLLRPFDVDKWIFRDLVTLMFGIMIPTPHNSTRSFHNAIPGSTDTSNLNKRLHSHGALFQELSLAAIISTIVWCAGQKDVYSNTPVFISIDETFLEKSGKQKSIPYAYYCGHKKKHGFYLVVAHVQIGKYHTTGGFYIHDRRGKTKQELALDLLKMLHPHLSTFKRVTVLTDSAYPEKHLMTYVIRQCKWTWIGAIKSNRKADGKSAKNRFKFMCNRHYQTVSMYKRKFLAVGYRGSLSDPSHTGLFITTKTKKKSYTPVSWRYYYCSDPNLTVQEVFAFMRTAGVSKMISGR